MKSVFQRAADVVVVGVLLVLIAPAAAHALGQLVVPLLAFGGVVCVLRLVWFYTQL